MCGVCRDDTQGGIAGVVCTPNIKSRRLSEVRVSKTLVCVRIFNFARGV